MLSFIKWKDNHKTKPTKQLYLKTFIFVSLMLVLQPNLARASKEQTCRNAFNLKNYQIAARCYQTLYQHVDQHPTWKRDKDTWKDRFLRHAAFSYQKAAKQSTKVEEQSYLKELASQLFELSFQKGHCEASNRCRINLLISQKLRKEIKYASLLLLTGEKKTKIKVTGRHYQKQSYSSFNQKLRPGNYKIEITDPHHKPRTKTLYLAPNQSLTINITSAKFVVVRKTILTQKKIPAWVWAGYITGAGLLALSTGMLTYGLVTQSQLNQTLLDPIANQTLREETYNDTFDNAERIRKGGLIAGGIGLMTLFSGIATHYYFGRENKKDPASTRQTSQMKQTLVSIRF